MARNPRKQTLRSLIKKQGDADFLLVAQKTELKRKGKPMLSMNWVVKADFKLEPDPVALVVRQADYILAAHRDAIKEGVKADGSGNQPPLDGSNRGGAWRRAKEGRRPNTRGNISGTMADNFSRGKIKLKEVSSAFTRKVLAKGKPVAGKKIRRKSRTRAARVAEARADIFVNNVDSRGQRSDAKFGPNKGQYVALIQAEEKRGVIYHWTTGDIADGISIINDQFLKEVVDDAAWKVIGAGAEERAKNAKF